MGWSFRKSKSFGLFRLNFSSSGVGVSFGVKGARVSMNKRGTYVNLGANGIYYRQRIDKAKNNPQQNFVPPALDYTPETPHTITSGNIDAITDVDSRAFIEELESKASRTSLLKWLGIWPSLIVMIYALSFANDVVREVMTKRDVFIINKPIVHVRNEPSTNGESIAMAKHGDQFVMDAIDSSGWVQVTSNSLGDIGFIRSDMGEVAQVEDSHIKIKRLEEYPALRVGYALLAIILIGWCVYLHFLDKKRKTLSIYYTLDQEIEMLHEKFLDYFSAFATSKKIWQKLHATGVADAKYHAGASQLVSRTSVRGVLSHKLPLPFLKTNISIPCITLTNTELYFFPERLIVKRGDKFGAVFYRNISIEKADVNFVESEIVPADAEVVDHTWKYLNKSGGPDRRFSDNRQLPVCRYSDYTFTSDGGLNEVITTSRAGAMDNFVTFIKAIGEFQMRA